MIPAPTVFDVFRMFRNDPQPITDEQLKKNYGDSLLAHTYLPGLVEEGWILRNENGWYMSKKAIDAAIQNAEEKIKGWQERIAHMQSLLPQPIIKLDDPITDEEWLTIKSVVKMESIRSFLTDLQSSGNKPSIAKPTGGQLEYLNNALRLKGYKFRVKTTNNHRHGVHFKYKEFHIVRIP